MGGILAADCMPSLPTTGSDIFGMLMLGLLLVLAGGGMLVLHRRSPGALGASTLMLLAVLACFDVSATDRVDAHDCGGSAAATSTTSTTSSTTTSTTLVGSGAGTVTTTTAAGAISTSSTSTTSTSTTSTTIVTPRPPADVPEVPAPAILGVAGALAFFGFAVVDRLRLRHPRTPIPDAPGR